MVSVLSDFQFALSEVNYWQRNVNTDLFFHFVVVVTCFGSDNFIYLEKVQMLVKYIEQKRK